MRTFYFFLLALSVFSCQSNKEASRVIISGKLADIQAESLTLRTHGQLKFYEQQDISEEIKIQDNAFSDTLELQEGHYVLQAGDVKRSLYLKPGYELQLNIKDSALKISGKGAIENQYMQEREEQYAKLRGYNSYQYYSQLPEDEFLKSADSIENLGLQLISKFKGMDDRLANTEKNWIKVIRADKLALYPLTRARFAAPDYSPSPNYPEAMGELDLNNESLLDVSLFSMIMLTSSGHKAKDLGMERWEYIISDAYPSQNPKIQKEILYLAGLYTMASFEDVDGYYEKASAIITDKEKWATIDSKYKQLTRLEKGRPAPDFELKNMQGESISLDDFKGNVVYLDFWASWCRPCIEEMPAFKKLQEDFAASNIKFVSIGIESKKESLEKLIQAQGLEGIHLFDPAQEEDLKKRYNVEGIPRYVLIDSDGKMIEKKAKRPSDPTLKTQLKELLN